MASKYHEETDICTLTLTNRTPISLQEDTYLLDLNAGRSVLF